VGDLKQEDFQVFDNDKPRPVSGFSREMRGATPGNTGGKLESVAQPASPADSTPPTPPRFVVFLFDDMHMSVQDMSHVKMAGAKVLAGALASSDMAAVVSTSGKTNSGLTRDRAKLQDAIMSLQTRSFYGADSAECPSIDYYQADLIENKHDYTATQDAIHKVFNCNPGLDAQRDMAVAQNQADSAARRALSLGEQDLQATYAAISEFVRRMANLPGQRTIILVSSGFQPLEQGARTAESRLMDLAAQSNVTISALDARGLYTTEWTASERGPALSGPSLLANSDYHTSAMKMAENGMEELADGTGGTFFHNSNNLDAGFKSLAEAPELVYVLELSLDNVKLDGTYHRLKVKVDREGVELQARRGFFVAKPEKNKK
jgi:VWFA-related protein